MDTNNEILRFTLIDNREMCDMDNKYQDNKNIYQVMNIPNQ